MPNTSTYNGLYYAHNKARITARRRARRLAMSEYEREIEREKQRERSRKYTAKRKAALAELVTLVNELLNNREGAAHV